MRDVYIPDMTERYPEGLNGVDMFAPYDWEADAWDELEREYQEAERQEIENITRAGYEVIKQTADGWTLARCADTIRRNLILCVIKGGEIISLYDSARNNPDNLASMLETWQEIAAEK